MVSYWFGAEWQLEHPEQVSVLLIVQSRKKAFVEPLSRLQLYTTSGLRTYVRHAPANGGGELGAFVPQLKIYSLTQGRTVGASSEGPVGPRAGTASRFAY